MRIASLSALAFVTVTGFSTAAFAGPIWVFSDSTGSQASDVGVITLTQNGANSVKVSVDLKDGYGFINSGGPHTPFAFNLKGSGALDISFTTPAGGHYTHKGPHNSIVQETLSLDTLGGSNTPFGAFSVAIDDTAGNGSGSGYFGDLLFTLTRATGLSTDDFIANDDGVFFSADLSNGDKTGAQAWSVGIDPPGPSTERVPEPVTMSLFGAGLAGAFAARRRKKQA
ncbi:MAG TPA: PEP-CTERM sorting domain-containing protein [Rhizomicrobium sp.]|nr:PEP-CTERM sorting domain-containing protein [Rhizomicrobium sp.]